MKIGIFGAGGFGHELIGPLRAANARAGQAAELVFIDDDLQRPAHLPVVPLEGMTPGDHYIVAVGDGTVREKIDNRCQAFGLLPWTYVGDFVSIGINNQWADGIVLCDYSMITANVVIGRQFQSNIYSYVAHDCVIGDYVTFAPRVNCNGNVHIEDYAYIGTGAVLRQGRPDKPLRIGRGAVVGMGAVVTKDVAPGSVVIGNPARPKS